MNNTISGGCACAAIRYEISDKPMVMNDCQCRDCQHMDDPSRYDPQVVTYGVRGYAWDHVDPELPKFDKMPP